MFNKLRKNMGTLKAEMFGGLPENYAGYKKTRIIKGKISPYALTTPIFELYRGSSGRSFEYGVHIDGVYMDTNEKFSGFVSRPNPCDTIRVMQKNGGSVKYVNPKGYVLSNKTYNGVVAVKEIKLDGSNTIYTVLTDVELHDPDRKYTQEDKVYVYILMFHDQDDKVCGIYVGHTGLEFTEAVKQNKLNPSDFFIERMSRLGATSDKPLLYRTLRPTEDSEVVGFEDRLISKLAEKNANSMV